MIELFLVAVQGSVQVVRRSRMPENGLLPDGSDSSVRAVIRWPPRDHPALVSGVAPPLQQQLASRHRRCRNACGPFPTAASLLYLNAQLPPYAESTKQRIVHYVLRNPGRTGGEIASALGLDKSRVNSFLYSEGRRRFGLQDNNWRWSATGVVSSNRRTSRRSTVYVPPSPSSGRSRERQLPITSICGSLSRLSITDATLKIRGMNEQQINLAFAEDDYGMLDDRLQAELAMRRSELLNARPAEAVPSSPFSNPLVLIGLGLMVVIFLGNVMSNSSSDRLPQRSVPGSVR